MASKEELISLAEAATVSGLHSAHLRKLAERGDLEARKIGRNWVTTAAAVKRYLGDTEKRSNDPKKRSNDPKKRSNDPKKRTR